MRSSFLPKCKPKIPRISAIPYNQRSKYFFWWFFGQCRQFFGYNPCLFGRAEILVLFGLHFGRKDDLINSFWIFILNSTDFTLFLCFVQILVYNQNGNSKTKVTSRLQIKYYCFGEGDQEVAGISRMPFLKPNHLMSHRKWSN